MWSGGWRSVLCWWEFQSFCSAPSAASQPGADARSGRLRLWVLQHQTVAPSFLVDDLANALERRQLLTEPRHIGPELLDRGVRTPGRQRHLFSGEELARIDKEEREHLPLALRQGRRYFVTAAVDRSMLGVEGQPPKFDLG